LPAYINDLGYAAVVGGWSLGLIGLFNVAGSFASGWVGQNWSKRNSLSFLYTARAIVIAVFIVTPASPMSILVFSCVMGLLWLSTVPLTMALVAQTQGLKYFSTMAGIIFLGHQIGSFTGAWLGGRIYDAYGDYTVMWWAAVVFGIMAAIIHIPIKEERSAQAA
jgi:predicted MFS family arabinose efflux permease